MGLKLNGILNFLFHDGEIKILGSNINSINNAIKEDTLEVNTVKIKRHMFRCLVIRMQGKIIIQKYLIDSLKIRQS